MPPTSTSERLADRRPLTLILRLLFDAQGTLVYGEVVDIEGEICGRFIEWPDLTTVVRRFVERKTADTEEGKTFRHP